MLDLVSDGRVDFGSGESTSEAELGGFHIDPLLKRDMWLEGLEVAVRCMVETPFTGVDGRFVQMPPRNVLPKPKQRPHPPLWVACCRRETILLAAEKGIGALTFAFIDPEEARTGSPSTSTRWREVRAGRLGDQPAGRLRQPDDDAPRRGRGHPPRHRGRQLLRLLARPLLRVRRAPAGVDRRVAEYVARRAAQGFDPDAIAQAVKEERLGAKVAAGDSTGLRGAIGTPDQVREYLRRYEEAGVDQVIFVMQAGRNSHEHIMESIEIFGREVLPEFADRDPDLATKAGSTGADRGGGAGPQGRRTRRSRRLHVPGHPPAVGRRGGSEEMKALLRALGRRPGRRTRDESAASPAESR